MNALGRRIPARGCGEQGATTATSYGASRVALPCRDLARARENTKGAVPRRLAMSEGGR
jgi:hypothetical protein